VNAALSKHDRLRNALLGLPVDRTPVWLMRQAGRYMAVYRKIRAEVSFLELCADARLCAEVTCQPVDAYDLDAAIVFSDILTVPAAMGQGLSFGTGHGPELSPVIRTADDVAALSTPDVGTALAPAHDAIRHFRSLRPEVPILGFAGSPWTLLCYMVEGRGSKDFARAKRLLWEAPDVARTLLDRLADVVGDHLQAQAEAGAAAVQLFDTWAGVLAPEEARAFALPAAARALARVKGVPRIYFAKAGGDLLPWLSETGADAQGLDWKVDLRRAREVLGGTPVQGNLDPYLLFAPPEVLTARVHDVLRAAGPVGHVFNLGHGIHKQTPEESVTTLVDAVRSFEHAGTA